MEPPNWLRLTRSHMDHCTYTYYVGLDVHRKMIAYCVKTAAGEIVREGEIPAQREALKTWAQSLGNDWVCGLEATICGHWIYNFLRTYAKSIRMAQPAKLKALQAGKKKSDELDARMLADLLRCNLFPDCYVIPPEWERLRRQLRYRRLLVRQQVLFKNKAAGLLIEHGVPYETKKLHGKKYFAELLKNGEGMTEQLAALLRLNRSQLEGLEKLDRGILRVLRNDALLKPRFLALKSVDAVGEITALTWALEVAHPSRLPNQSKAISYCGLCSRLHESAGKERRQHFSKQRNSELQMVLIEAAHLAPRFNEKLRALHQRERDRGAKPNEATIAVARKLVCYLLAVDRAFFADQQSAKPLAKAALVA